MSKISPRDIIVNACDAARLVNRSQPVPANIFVTAFTLLQRRLDGYSNTHLLSFTQKEVNVDLNKTSITFGKFVPKDNVVIVDTIDGYMPEMVGIYVFDKSTKKAYLVNSSRELIYQGDDRRDLFEVYPDVEVNDLHEITRCYVNNTNLEDRWLELDYVSFEDFYDRSYGCGVYTVNIKSDDEQELKLKEPLTFQKLKIIYTAPFEFDVDTEFNIPKQYISLFTAGLTYDLAMTYPRLGDSTVAMLKSRLDELEENVRRSSAVNKFIGRDVYRRGMTYADFKNGLFLL